MIFKSQLGIGTILITPLYSNTTKSEPFFDKKKTLKITKKSHAFKGYASFCNVETLNFLNPELQLKDTKPTNKKKLNTLLSELKGFKFVITLVLQVKKMQSNDNTLENKHFYSEEEAIINENNSDYVFDAIYVTILSNIQKFIEQGYSQI